MKKLAILAAAVMAVAVLCSCSTVPAEEHSAVLLERDELAAENASLREQYDALCREMDALQENADMNSEVVDATISGWFTATVRSVMPDYVIDSTSPRVAVVTTFQGEPFTVHLGSDLISEIVVGETYVFELEPRQLQMTQQQLDNCPRWPEAVMPLYGLSISAVRSPGQDELGLDGCAITCEPVA